MIELVGRDAPITIASNASPSPPLDFVNLV